MKTLSLDEVEVGDALPELVIELTPTRIVASAIASRDYERVHHDRDRAQESGAKDIFMNILSSNGFVGRYVTDWAGPEAILERVAIRLGAPNYPGDEMRLTGQVERAERVDGQARVEVRVRGANSLGDHVVGTVQLRLPGGAGS